MKERPLAPHRTPSHSPRPLGLTPFSRNNELLHCSGKAPECRERRNCSGTPQHAVKLNRESDHQPHLHVRNTELRFRFPSAVLSDEFRTNRVQEIKCRITRNATFSPLRLHVVVTYATQNYYAEKECSAYFVLSSSPSSRTRHTH